MDTLTPNQLIKVLKTARAHSVRNWTMHNLTAFTHGLRATEVCKRKMSDLKDGHGRIKRSKGQQRETTHQLVPHRGLSSLDEVKAVKAWLAERPTDAGDALFPSNKGGCMSATQFYRIYRAVAEECGLPASKQHPHVLKHTIAPSSFALI